MKVIDALGWLLTFALGLLLVGTAMPAAQRRPGRRSRQEELESVRHLIHVRTDPWLLAQSRWASAPFVIELADAMFRNRTASRALALRHAVRQALRSIAEDFGETTTGRLALALADTDERQSVLAPRLGISETWLSKEYLPRITALLLAALTRMDEDSGH